MIAEVTSRFIQCLEYLKTKHYIRSARQFAMTIDLHPQCLSDIVRGKREVNSDIILRATKEYKLNPTFIYTGSGSLLLSESTQLPSIQNPIVTVVTDSVGNERIVYVPITAQAGYGGQLHDPTFIGDLPTFSLPDPRFSNGSYRCFDVAGDSMEPTIYNGDKVVCSFVEKENWFNGIKEKYVYVIITKEGVVVKRIVNNLKTNGTISLISDNDYWDPFEIELKDIEEVWQVAVKISPFFPSPSNVRNGLHTEVDLLKTTISDQSLLIRSLNSTVEKLLKQNRTTTVR